MSDDYYNDYQFQIDYDPQVNKFAFLRDDTGATTPEALSLKDYTDTDDNTIYLNTSTGSDAAAGTKAAPKKTLLDAIDSCTVTKTKVIVLNSVLIVEDLSTMTNEYFEGVFEDTSITVTLTRRTLGYTPADANSIFFDKTGGAGGTGTQADPVLTIAQAIALCDATHQAIVCQDSETYTEPGIEFTGNFLGMYAADGEVPTYIPTVTEDVSIYTDAAEKLAATTVNANQLQYIDSVLLANGNLFFVTADDTDNKLKGVIHDTDGNVEVAEFDIVSSFCTVPRCVVLDDNNILIAYEKSATTFGYFQIWTQLGINVKTETAFSAAVTEWISLNKLNNGNWVVAWAEGGASGQFRIYDEDGTQVKAKTQFEANRPKFIYTLTLANDDWVIAYNDFDDNDSNFIIYDEDGTVSKAKTQFTANDIQYIPSMCLLGNSDWVLAYYRAAGNKFIIYTEAGAVGTAETAVTGGRSPLNVTTLSNSDFLYASADQANSDRGIFSIYNEDGSLEVLTDTVFETGDIHLGLTTGSLVTYLTDNNNIVIVFIEDSDGDKGKFVIWQPYGGKGLEISATSIINGWIFDGSSTQLTRIINLNSAALTLSYSTLKDADNSTGADSIIAYAVYSDDEPSINNCIIGDNGGGVYSANNTAAINNTLFYRNDYGYAIHIDGTGATIVIGQNTFFSNEGGIRLENNGGSESIKNCIFHGNNVYDIYADTSVGFTYSTYTGSLSGATAGTNVIQANPLFINEGGLVAADIDLQIKIRLLGYPGDSPAYLLSDATTPDRDSGAWDMAYIGSTTTWTSFTVEKPVEIQIDLIPVGETKTERKDGSIESSVEGWTEQYTINFNGLKIADFNNIVLMLVSNNNEIRFYGDPTTNANDYVTCKLTYNPIQASPNGHYELSRTGVSDLEFKFSRKYE